MGVGSWKVGVGFSDSRRPAARRAARSGRRPAAAPRACRAPSRGRPSMTAMRSAMRTVENRCEITMPIRPLRFSFSSAKMPASASGIERGGRLVEDPDVGVAVHDARERQPLPLAARQIVAALEQPPDLGVEAVRHLLHQPLAARVPQRLQHPLVVGLCRPAGPSRRSRGPTARSSRSPGTARRSGCAAFSGSRSLRSTPPTRTDP